MTPRLAIDRGRSGTLISAFMFTCLVVSLIVGVVTDKLGFGPVAVFGFAAAALGILLLGPSQGLLPGGSVLHRSGLRRQGPEHGRDRSDRDEGTVDAAAQRMLAYFAVAMMAGRLIVSQVPNVTRDGSWIVAGVMLVSAAVIVGMAAAKKASRPRF